MSLPDGMVRAAADAMEYTWPRQEIINSNTTAVETPWVQMGRAAVLATLLWLRSTDPEAHALRLRLASAQTPGAIVAALLAWEHRDVLAALEGEEVQRG